MNSLDNRTPTFLIKTLGCKVNQYETELMRECLKKNGFIEAVDEAAADFCIVNSCTVTASADKETRNLARHFCKVNPGAKIIIAGCGVEFEEDRKMLAALPGVTHLVRNHEKQLIAKLLIAPTIDYRPSTVDMISDFKDRDRAFIKAQDGCDHKCSYCKTGLVRGPSRSRKAGEILCEARALIANGFKEIVLTGVCLGAWGRDFEEKQEFADLVGELAGLQGDFRIRLSSIEPAYVNDRLLRIMQSTPKVCGHLHMPLQSADNRILKRMGRSYSARKFSHIVKKARKNMPDLGLTTDLLIGFPGEGESEFGNTLKFIQKIRPSRLHVFPYSARPYTKAARFKDTVVKNVKSERVRMLRGLGSALEIEFARTFIGKKELVLVESQRDKNTGMLTGYTDRYVRVLLDGPDSLKGKLTPVIIEPLDSDLFPSGSAIKLPTRTVPAVRALPLTMG